MNNNRRMIWVDWMKVIGMYFIVAGHLFPAGYPYIYVFNVPLFFLISGFLFHNDINMNVFIKKIILNYVLPLFLIRTIMYFWERYIYLDTSQFISISQYWLFMIKGYQNCNGACWFIYSLILLRIVFQFMPNKISYIVTFGILLTIIAYYLHFKGIHRGNAILNITVAYQPFAIGVFLKRYKNQLDQYSPSLPSALGLLFFSILSIAICEKINGEVWVFNNGYGRSFLLYLLGMFNGAVGVYTLSKIFTQFAQTIIYTLSFGNILTLGFHQIFVNIINIYMEPMPYFSYIMAIIIILLFYPIIILCNNRFPILLGIYRTHKK